MNWRRSFPGSATLSWNYSRKHSHGDTHSKSDGRTNKDRWAERISLSLSLSPSLSHAGAHAFPHTHTHLLTHTLLYTHHSDKRPLITQQMDAPLITGRPSYKLAYYAVSAWGGSVAGARGSVAVEG